MKIKIKPKANSPDCSKYNLRESEFGNSWLIGTDALSAWEDEWNYANAYRDGISCCPHDLIIPRKLTDDNGVTKIVEVIGNFAFFSCADKDFNGLTRKLTLTRQVKVIKQCGLARMDDLEVFKIEEGSVLEKIEHSGLHGFAYFPAINGRKRETLVLPSTLTSVAYRGIYHCNLFDTIIYCGSRALTEACDLESDDLSDTVVKVTRNYPSDANLFGRNPIRNSEDAEKLCSCIGSGIYAKPVIEEGENSVEISSCSYGDTLFCPQSFVLPDHIDQKTVVAISERGFVGCDIEGPISLPATVKRVGAFAFANASRATAVSSDGKSLDIGESAFEGCGEMADQPFRVSLPSNTRMNKSAFAEANVMEIYIT